MDRPAFEPESLLAHAGWLRTLAASLLADRSLADDVVQDTWVAALQRRPSDAQSLAPWLAQVVRNLASKRRRSGARRSEHEIHASSPNAAPTPAHTAEQLELQRVLLDALMSLEEPLRTTLFLRYFEGRTSAGIAQLQHVPAGTVRWRLKRGLDELRARLDARFGGNRATWCVAFAPLVARDAAELASSGAVTIAGAAAPGVLLMSAVWKLGAVAAVVVAGALWWSLRGSESTHGPRAASSAATTPNATPSSATVVDDEHDAVEPSNAQRESAPTPVAEVAAAAAPPVVDDRVSASADVRFVDGNGAPWSGVRFACVEGDGPLETLSDAEGRARLDFKLHPKAFDGLINGRRQTFRASRAGCATATLRASLQAEQTTHLGDVVLLPGSNVLGRVIDEIGAPLEGVRVGLMGAELPADEPERMHRHGHDAFEERIETRSAADGSYELPGVPAGKWRVWAHSEGRRYAWSEPFDVEPATDRFGLELVVPPLKPEDRLEGLVLDPRGEPVPRATLEIAYYGQHESGSTTFHARDDGSFRIVIYVPGTYCLLAGDPEHRYAKSGARELKPGMLDIVVRLGEPRFVDVRVHDADGQPITGSQVFEGTRDHGVADDASTVPEGRTLPRVAVPLHPFVVVAAAPGFRRLELGPFEPSSVGDAIDVVLERLPIVRGRVTVDGAPIAGASVALHPSRWCSFNGFDCRVDFQPTVSTRTDASGAFELGCEIEEGELWIVAEAKGWTKAEIGPLSPSEAAHGEHSLDLTHGGTIEGRVRTASGESGEGAIIGLNHGDARPRTLRAGPNGAFRVEGLAPGPWQVLLREREVSTTGITIMDNGERRDIAWTCEVAAGATTRVELEMPER